MLLVAALACAGGVVLYHRNRTSREERRVGDLAGILGMDGPRFDAFVARLYRKDGWWAFEPHAAAEREGVDIRLERGGETWLVRTRNWRYRRVSAGDVRDFYALVVDRNASGGYFVTTSTFSPEAATFAKRVPRTRPMGLIDGDELLDWARRGRVSQRGARVPTPVELVLGSFQELDPPDFTRQVLAAWQRQGYAVAAGGAPVIRIDRDGERLLVQCLAADAGEPSIESAAPLLEAVGKDRVDGVLVSAVEVPGDVQRHLRDQRVDVIDGELLARFLAAGSGNPQAAASRS